jgi:hypothetical protein
VNGALTRGVFKEGEATSRGGSLPSPYQPESLLALRSAGAARGGGTALTGDASEILQTSLPNP